MGILPFLLDIDVGGPAANLASSSTLTATGQVIHGLNANLSSRSTLTAAGVSTSYAAATLQARSTLTASGKIPLYYVPDGGNTLTGGEAATDYAIFFEQQIEWQTRAAIEINKEFQWNTGLLPLRWFRVQGCCQYPTPAGSGDPNILPSLPNPPLPGGCPTIGIQTDDDKCVGATGRQQFIQNIFARSLSDLCNQLTESRLNWEICSIKQWSRPADSADVSPSDQCNTLTEVPFQDVVECLPFSIHTDGIVRMGITTYAIDAIFKYEGTGGALTGGEAETEIWGGSTPTQSFFEFISSGDICLTGGEAETDTSWQVDFLTTMGMSTVIERVEAVFSGSDTGPALDLPPDSTGTACGTCDSMPTLLYLHYNLAPNDNILTNFMHRNGLELPNPLPMHYSSRLQSWVANHHMIGTGDTNMGTLESWRFTFEWACLNEIAGSEFGSPSWKFSMLVVRKNEATGLDYDTRSMTVFPPDQLCSGSQNLGFDFSFSINTATKFVGNDLEIVPSSVLLTDNIGLFKSKFWTKNPKFNIRLSKSDVATAVQRQDIYPIFPQA